LKRHSQSSNAKWINSQVPDSCQSRRRLQQVIAEPQPNSFGNISQGTPLRRTNTMPLRQARSGTRGRPPCGLGFGNGKRGSITFHRQSGTSAVAITPHLNGGTTFRARPSRDEMPVKKGDAGYSTGDSRTLQAKDYPQLKTCRYAFPALTPTEPLASGALSDSDTALLVSEL
jgi:hypothetical protein